MQPEEEHGHSVVSAMGIYGAGARGRGVLEMRLCWIGDLVMMMMAEVEAVGGCVARLVEIGQADRILVGVVLVLF